jgi:hypothetical protein
MTFRYDDGEDAIPQGMMGAVWAFGWGAAAASGVLVGAILGLMTHLRHRAIAATRWLSISAALGGECRVVLAFIRVLDRPDAPQLTRGTALGSRLLSARVRQLHRWCFANLLSSRKRQVVCTPASPRLHPEALSARQEVYSVVGFGR